MPVGGRLPMGCSVGPQAGPTYLVVGDAAGTVNPFNGEGIAYGYETGRLGAGVLGEALLTDNPSMLALYDERLELAYGDYFKVARAFADGSRCRSGRRAAQTLRPLCRPYRGDGARRRLSGGHRRSEP